MSPVEIGNHERVAQALKIRHTATPNLVILHGMEITKATISARIEATEEGMVVGAQTV